MQEWQFAATQGKMKKKFNICHLHPWKQIISLVQILFYYLSAF